MAALVLSLAICCSLLVQTAVAIPLSQFYEFGPPLDQDLGRNDDDSAGPIQLSRVFTFYETSHTSLYVNNNGDISFGRAFGAFSPESFPLDDNIQLIAPFWADVDTRTRGNVHYREVDTISETETVMRVESEVGCLFSDHVDFRADLIFIATWVNVSFFGGSSSPLINTFQCVLTSDGQRSFTFFLYADGLIQWPRNQQNQEAGFNAGDRERFYSIPVSQIDGRPDLDTTSNVDMPGVWVFQVSGPEVVSEPIPSCNNSAPLSITPDSGAIGVTTITITGPCFNPFEDITCDFDGEQTTGVYINRCMAICTTPFFENKGLRDLTVIIWNGITIRYSMVTSFEVVEGPESGSGDIDIFPSTAPPTTASTAPPTTAASTALPTTAAPTAPPTTASTAPPTTASTAPPTTASTPPPTTASTAPPTTSPTAPPTGPTTCVCQQQVRCSIEGYFVTLRDAFIPTGTTLHCVIDYATTAGSGDEMMPIGSGMSFRATPIAIDETFNGDTLSAGSLIFLDFQNLDFQNTGFAGCDPSPAATDEELLREYLDMEQISLTFQHTNGQFDSLSLDIETAGEIALTEDFSIGGRLDDVQQCSFQNLLSMLSRPASFYYASYTFGCRRPFDRDGPTIITFNVFCPVM